MKRCDFYKSLARIAHHFTWKVDETGALRGKPTNRSLWDVYCPLEARSFIMFENESWSNNGDLNEEDVNCIIAAADNKLSEIDDYNVKRARQALFNAVGLKKGL